MAAENVEKFSKTVQMSFELLARPTKMLHLQRDASPRDDKRFNLLLAMSEEKMSNNLLRTVLDGDGTKMPGVQISTEAWSGRGRGNCSRC
jgi:hypothetical protein